MTFALTNAEFNGIDLAGNTRKRGIQRVALTITAAATDVDLDIGDDAGTFWTAALADATYGALAAKVQTLLQTLDDQVVGLISVGSPQLLDRRQAGGTVATVQALDSTATAGTTGATRTLAVPGLLTTDTILGATIVEDGAVPAYIQEAAKTCAVADQYVVTFSADPEAGCEVRVLISRNGTQAPAAGQYSLAIENHRPNITCAAASGETSWNIVMEWELKDGQFPINAIYGNAA